MRGRVRVTKKAPEDVPQHTKTSEEVEHVGPIAFPILEKDPSESTGYYRPDLITCKEN